jgi:hypothetical protein
MGLFEVFRRQPPIRDLGELADFIDANAAFLVQKGIYEYARARSGHYSKVLFSEPEFHEAIEKSRWRAYPLGLAMVGEMVEGALHPFAAADRRAALDPLIALVLSVFDRYPIPPELGDATWSEARAELARKLDQIGTHPPKRVIDIPEVYAERYFNMMPFDKSVLTRDMPTTRSYLRLNLIHIHDELLKRADMRLLADKLRAGRV